MLVKRMDNFICEIASHDAQCGMAPVLVERKTHYCETMLYLHRHQGIVYIYVPVKY
jgi:hypothetical protein